MFAFVGYIVHANGIHFPWAMELDGTPFPEVSSAPEAWDSISDAAKWQIFTFIGFLEVVSTLLCVFAGVFEALDDVLQSWWSSLMVSFCVFPI